MSTVKPRWYRLTPDRFLVGLLAAVLLLLLADRLEWFGLERGSGWNVLLAVGIVAAAVPVGLLWFGVGLLRKRPFQFSLRSLMLFVLVCAVACSWFAVKMRAAERQKVARGVLWEFAGIKKWDYQHASRAQPPPGPVWLHKLLGEDFLCDVEFLCLGGGDKFTDAELAHVARLPRIKFLRLGGAGITDRGLKQLRGLTELEDLNFNGTEISDAGLEHLRGLIKLERLLLGRTHVSDVGLMHLKGLTKLQYLSLSDTDVTDAGLVHLEGLANLETLYLRNTQVTRQGVEELRKALPNCKIAD